MKNSKRNPTIPDLPPLQLRDLANRAAREDGYSVKSIPSVNSDRTALIVVFTAADGMTFPGSISAHACAKHLDIAGGLKL